MLEEKWEKFLNSCRICLGKKRKVTSIYKSVADGDDQPSEMLSKIIGVDLAKYKHNTNWPSKICKNCELSLNLAYQFRQNALKAQHVIFTIFSKRMKSDIAINTNLSEYELEFQDSPIYNSLETDHGIEIFVENQSIEKFQESDSELQHNDELLSKIEYLDEAYLEFEAIADTDICSAEHDNIQNILIKSENNEHNENSAIADTNLCRSEDDNIQNISIKSENNQYNESSTQNLCDIENSDQAVIRASPDFSSNALDDKQSISKEANKLFKVKRKCKKLQDTRHICDVCGNIFAKRGRLMEHRRRHNKELRYSCELCDKRFNLRELLRKHMFMHSGGKPYKCNYCSRSFFYESVKKSHEAIHNGHKPYICDHCDKAFAYAHALKKHELIHANIKLYHCQYCDKDFRLQHHMKQHEDTQIHQAAVQAAVQAASQNGAAYIMAISN